MRDDAVGAVGVVGAEHGAGRARRDGARGRWPDGRGRGPRTVSARMARSRMRRLAAAWMR